MKFLAVDGNSIFYRAFYAVRLLSTKDGFFTNAIYGFINILLKELGDTSYDYAAIAFDLPSPTFRHKDYAAYKAGRKPAPDELKMQMPVLQELLGHLGFRVVTCEGFEADDILGTVSRICRGLGGECVLLTGDRDSFQLVGKGVTLHLATTRGGTAQSIYYDENTIKEEYGIDDPQGMIEIKALMGDASDNIPGVAGIGPKTASALICAYGNIDYIYDHIDEIDVTPKVREMLKKGKENAFLSRQLATVNCAAPIESDPEYYAIKPMNREKTAALLTKLEMNSVLKRLELVDIKPTAAPSAPIDEVKEVTCISLEDGELLKKLAGQSCALEVEWDDSLPAGFTAAVGGEVFTPSSYSHELLLKILWDESIAKTVYDAKALHRFALSNGGRMLSVPMSLDIAAYLLDPDASGYNLITLCDKYGVGCPTECADRAAAMEKLGDKLSQLMVEKGLGALLRDIELPLSEVLASMELTGIRLDAPALKDYGVKLQERLVTIEKEIYDQSGTTFNINSPKQLGEVLFDKLGLPVRRKTKSGYSTDSEVLESLKTYHPVPALIIDYRTLAKLKSTYVDSLTKLQAEDGRIHSTFLQTQARTGRLSSANPNMQNIPIRTQLGGELRKFFIPEEGYVFVDADYSQIELRILAHMADDDAMRGAFLDGVDIHFKTASEIFHMPPPMVTPLMRSRAKAVNFGIVYGMGAFSLSKDTGVSMKEASGYIADYFATYKGVQHFLETTVENAKKNGYVTTMFGRIRPLSEISSGNKVLAAVGERMAKNTPIQGTAADIMKIAMVKVYDRLLKEGMKSRLILQVHDELILESPTDEAERAAQLLKEEMEGAVHLTVPLTADVHTGDSWYSAK